MAGIYNPGDPDEKASSPGSIGGTHVIYVLDDARNPEKYGGLPAAPSVPVFREVMEGPTEMALAVSA